MMIVRRAMAGAALLTLLGCGGGGGGGGTTPQPPANRAPVFTSAATAGAPENATGTVYTATATDPDGNALTFAIAGGADAARFTITPAGALAFSAAPDFEAPADADRNNVYLVQLSVSDGSLSVTIDLAVTVTNVAGETFALRSIAQGLAQPLYVAPVPGDTRVFVLEKGGRILLLDPTRYTIQTSELQQATFLNLAGTISTDGERGLLGLAAAPDYATSGVFYVYVTNPVGDIEIRRYRRLDANRGDPASGDVILTIPHRQFNNHNGGWLGFGPDGMLHILTGDGGGAGDPLNNAQNLQSLLGKVLRIDVGRDSFPDDPNRDFAVPEDNPVFAGGAALGVAAIGLRNPFRGSFDGANLLIGDVGQDAREEVNLLRPQDRGRNFGWPFLEGTRPYRGTAPSGLTPPVTEYEHGDGPSQGESVTGGYVYRGPVTSLQGQYVFGDFVRQRVWSVPASELVQGTTLPASRYTLRTDLQRTPDRLILNLVFNLVSFGEDAARNLYLVKFNGDFGGEVYVVRAES